MKSDVAVKMTGGNGARRKHDFYATPMDATLALLKAVRFHDNIWEPACGDGALVRVLRLEGYRVFATDLVDRGHGLTGLNFLDCNRPFNGDVITNPPFTHAADFIRHSRKITNVRAFLLKQTFWNVRKNYDLYFEDPPDLILPLTWRVDFTGQGRGLMDVMWNVWGAKKRETRPLPRPSMSDMALFG